jgi:ATP-dependent helicase/nuclease subunit B
MLQIVTGPFHPHLQQALIREVRQFKTDNPLGSLAIIVPSSTLSHYLRRLLVLKAGLSLLNVHFLTFHQLALRLCEAGGPVTGSGTAPVVPGSDLFFEELLRTIVRRNLTGLERFRQFGHSQGAWAALWATLRDLTEAMVDPETARRAVEEGLFGIEDAEPLRALFHLHAAAREACRALGVGTPEDVAAAALERVPDSAVLLRLDRLYYYGFYDLTQVQLALFEAIAASRPVTLFFPLTDQPEFGFARRFFERHLSPRTMAQYVARLPDPPTARGHGPAILRFSTVEAEDELATVCKQILLLVETHGYRFEEIGVVARTLAPYQAKLRPIFDRHRIPLQSLGDALPGGAGLPLNQEPAAKALLQLASLPVTGLYRTPVMDVLTSPFCRWDRLGEKIEPRPDLWTLAVRQLGITRGLDEWQRLAAAAQDGLVLEAGAEMDDGETEPERSRSIAPSQLHLLWRLVSGLLEEIRALPASGSFGELTAAFLKVASGQLKVPGLSEAGQLDLPEPRLDAVGQSIRAVFTALAQFEQIGHAVSWEEWLRVFTRLVAEATVADCEQNHGGVWVLDAMAARGLAFRALFLIGLNEKVFPRFIREDAFLRDRHRRVLDATLGYKIDEKLAGYDEERLLFTLLVQAAQERLFLLYQRADAAGRA